MSKLPDRIRLPGLLALLALAASAALSGCDDRLPRPFEPTTPHKSNLAEQVGSAIESQLT